MEVGRDSLKYCKIASVNFYVGCATDHRYILVIKNFNVWLIQSIIDSAGYGMSVLLNQTQPSQKYMVGK